jgi:hypothetical protein
MRKVIFIKDFATFKKGDVNEFGSAMASRLVNASKVAKYSDDDEPVKSNTGDSDNVVDDVIEGAKKGLKKMFGKNK